MEPVSESGTETILASDSSSKATLMAFRGWHRTGLISVQIKILYSLRSFFARTELLALVSVDSLGLLSVAPSFCI